MRRPKYSLETEHTVLESILGWGEHTNSRVQKAMLKLSVDTFYNVDHQLIFAMVRENFNKQEPFDFVTILTQIDRNEDGLHLTVSNLIQTYRTTHASDANFEAYVDRIITLAQLRKQLYLAERMLDEVNDCGSPEKSTELLATALTEISGISYREEKHGISNIQIAEAYYDGKIVEPKPIPTTCEQLNEGLGGGIMPKCLIFAAAAPSTGKTGFAIFLMDAIARAQPDTESLFFSLEMEYKHIWMRHVGICAGKPFDQLNEREKMDAVTKSIQVPMKVYDTFMCKNGADLDFILTTSRLRAMEKKISVIVVDYIGLVKVKGKFERNDLKLAEITDQLGQLAIELDCTVILLSQINRGAANRSDEDRCPWPHDAANGSGGHNSASIWLGLDRPELYRDDPLFRNQFVVKCRKNRFGDLFDLIFAFNGGSFAEVPQGWFKQPMKTTFSPDKALFSAHGRDFSEN